MMNNSDQIRGTMALLDRLDANDYSHVRTQIDCAKMLLRDIAIACVVQEAEPDMWQIIAEERGKIPRVKKARELLCLGLKDAKELIEQHFDENGYGALVAAKD